MRVEWKKKHIFMAGLSVMLVLSILFFMYTRLIVPTRENSEQAEMRLEAEEKIFASIQEQVKKRPLELVETSFMMQRQLPVKALTDQVLLALARAEGMSGTMILSIDMVESSFDSSQQEEKADEADSASFSSLETEKEVEESVSLADTVPETIEGLETIRLDLTVRAKDYAGLARFTKEIDQLDRIFNIDSISFIGPNERTKVEEEVEDFLEFSVSVSTFYYPMATGLENELPQIEYPKSGNKQSPFYNNK